MSDLYMDRNGELKRRNEGRMQLFIARPYEGAPPTDKTPRNHQKGGWFQADGARELISRGMALHDMPDSGSRVELTHNAAWLKGGRLKLESSLRHGFKRLVLRQPFPRIAEFHNLSWLRAHDLPAPKPLVACVWSLRLIARLQFLATEWIADAPSLLTLIEKRAPNVPDALSATGQVVKRMHTAGFVHRNCFPRNFIVDGEGAVWILDAWRGGPKATNTAVDVQDFEARLAELQVDPTPFRDGYASGV